MMPTHQRRLLAFAVATVVVATTTTTAHAASNIVLKPVEGKTGPAAAFIFIEGAEIAGDLYTPLLQQVQNASNLSLWVGIPAFLGNTPEPIRLAADITATLKDLEKAGFNSGGDALYFYGAHSLGTVFIQDYVSANASHASGQVLTGGFLSRKHYNVSNTCLLYTSPSPRDRG